ncbi:hypothetical protein EV143_101502 [Flavobacterium chryseum]|uniref:T9SS sorting signal type C domain-containing protein n=1 Tax=Flavobacterium sp. P3160 TaxID=2512113 RepID=UPI0010601B21|nr:T9SS sorting signal type C domain-containing protein [Flavobacterium sp. P3160]TDO84057.1 hypothetical protein EV143_101502 [Flavobacterium sp. P3160]
MIRKLLLLVHSLFFNSLSQKSYTQNAKLLCLVMFFVVLNVKSQVANYTFSQTAGTYTAIAGTTVHASGWDDNVSTNSIPFNFTFTYNNVNYTTCSINSNGFLTFGTTISATNEFNPISTGTTYAGAISALGRDLVSNGSNVVYTTTGTAPNRVFVVQWTNIRRYEARNNSGESFNFQIRLNESTNLIQVVYGSCSVNYTSDLTTQIGLRGPSSADFNNRLITNNWTASSAGGNNAATANTGTGKLPTSGLTFTWTPVVCSFSNFGTVTQITNIKFNSLDNNSNGTTSYENFTGLTPTTVYRDQSYSLNVKGNTGGNVNYYYTAFFDWNQDGDFLDSDEYYVVGTFRDSPAQNVVASVFVKIPATALLGNTTMRVIGHLGSYNTTPCAASDANNAGQVEDYTIKIGATCTATPAPGGTNSTANPVCSTTPFTLSLANETLGAPTYQWQTSTNGTDWVNATPSQPAFFSSDFSTPQAANTTVGIESVSGLDAKIEGGVLTLTDVAETGHQSAYFINKSLGSNVNAFTTSFDYKIWLGPADGADGLSLSYGDGFINNNGGGENGEGNGLILKLDTYDNDQVAVGGRIRINYGGNAIFATAIGAVALRNANYRNITLTVDNNGYLSLSLAGTSIISNLLLPGYTATNKSTWKFKFSARTGGNKDQHSIDNLVIKYLDVSANKSIYTTSQTAPTYYRALVTCGTNTTPSTGILINMISAVVTPISTSTCSGVAFTVTPTNGTNGTIPTGTTYSWPIPVVTGGLTGGAASTGTPSSISGTLANPTATAQTATYTVTPTTSGCAGVPFTVVITVNPNNTVTRTSLASTTNQTVCVNSAIANITYTTTGATGATFSGLPNGVTGSWASNVITISGSPSATAGPYNYTVTLTGGCGVVTATGSIAVTPANTVTLTSLASTTNQTVCVNSAIANITYSTTGATGATFSGLPNGVTGSWASNVITISGSPSVTTGPYNYTVTLTGGCGVVTATGSIAVTPANTVTLTSLASTTNQTVCVNSAIANITYTTTGATAATFSGLPTGVTGSWASNVVTISGSPSATAGPYNYTVTLTGGCGVVTANGSIAVTPANTVTLTSLASTTNQTVCVNSAIANITYTTTGATGATFSGLPTGVNGAWTANVVTINGTSSISGSFPYTVTLTGGCGNVIATGTITITPANTITLSSGAGTNNQTACINTALSNITFTTTGATGATFSGLPTGVSGTWAANVVTINGTTSISGSFPYTVTLTGGCGNVTTTGTIITSPLPVITSQPQPLAVCEGQGGSFSIVTSATSPTYQWEYSASLSGPWTATNGQAGVSGDNTASLSLTNVPVTYSNFYIRCTVTSNTCYTISNAVLLTVNPLPSAPSAGTTTSVSCTTTGSVALSNLPSGAWTINQTGFASNTINGSGTTYTVTGLAAGTYRFTVSNGTCTSVVSSDVTITDQSSTTWNGTAWSNLPPNATKAAIIAGTFAVSSDLTACSLTINTGINIVVPSDRTLYIINGLNVSSGSTLTFENHSSLVQVNNNAVNSGTITYKRIAAQIRQADYIYWSTPVTPQKLIDVSPYTLGDKFMGFNGNNWVITNKNTIMTVGKGYIIRGPQTFSNTVKADYEASFKGIPNNGIINGETLAAGKYYLIGNPYPSALDANTFITENNFLEGTLYFWTHNTPVVLSGAYKYSSTDYASYNLTGGVGTGLQAPSSNPSNNNSKPSGYIGAGQSFFASAATGGTIAFNNGMRLGAADNTQFFKSASKTAAVEKHRIWLNMTNTEGAFKQMLVGYVQGATNEYEPRYDGVSFDANTYIDFYSVANNNNYVIQARALPFTDTDLVPLGYRTTIAGEFTISIDQADGNMKNQVIYLEDKTTGTIHNLTQSDYKFTTVKGTFADRLVLRYTNKTLGTGDFENIENGLLVSVKDKTIKVLSSKENIKEVSIYDVSGKLLYNKKKVGNTELQIQNLQVANQVLLVKVTLDNNFTAAKKIIFN